MSRASPLLLLLLSCSEFVPRDDVQQGPTCALEPCEAIGASACDGDLVRVCVDAGGGCVGWSASASCSAAGERCAGAGVCGADACPTEGASLCQGPSGTVTCVAGASGFLEWSPYASCPPGFACVSDACAPVACDSEGVRVCAEDGVSFRTCRTVGGVLGWSDVTACGDGQVCAGGGQCGAHACDEVGASTCDGAAGTRTCEIGEDGFRRRGRAVACPSGQLCGPSGTCGLHECGPKGALECDGKNDVKECVSGTSGFLVWAPSTPCPDSMYCGAGGLCGTDGCPASGAAECVDAGNRRECVAGAGGFLDWADPVACPPKSVCVVDTCTPHECPGAGALACTDEKHLHQCIASPSGLLVWAPEQACEGTAMCKAQGVCGKDQCPEDGFTVCDGAAATKTCHVAPSEFLQWKAPLPCPGDGQTCKAGLCGQDLCPLGAASCQDGLVVTCAKGPDGFLAWTTPAECPAGTACLGAGACTPLGEVEVWPEAASGRPDTAATAGGLAVVFTGSVSGGTSVFLRRYSADGAPLEEAQDVSGVLAVSLPYPTVVALPDDGPHAVAVVWLAGSNGTLRVRRWLAPEKAPEPEVAFKPASPFATDPLPCSVRLSPGHVGVLDVEEPFAKQVVRLTVTDSVSVTSGPNALDSVLLAPITGLAAAPLPMGGALVAWTVGGSANSSRLTVLPVLADGQSDATPLDLQVELPNPGSPAVATAADGTAFVVYDIGTDTASTGVRARRIGADGTSLGAEIQINDIKAGDQQSPDATALPGGRWWVVWQGPDDAGAGIWGRVFDDAGVADSLEQLVNITTADALDVPSTCALADGRRFVVWRSGKGGAARVVGRFLDVAP